ncbi:MAG TPA: hypothetical protein VF712_10275 [Thermoleophilaceae bacterium]|jgi:hypothetical protein
MNRRTCLLACAVAAAFTVVPARASAAPVEDYSCDITSLTVHEELQTNRSGPFTASGSANCWTGDAGQKVSTQLSASGTYRALRCGLLDPAQPSYLTLTGTLTLTPSGSSSVSTGVTITTSDVATVNDSAGTISLESGQAGYVKVDYGVPVFGVIMRCHGADPFSPSYTGTFLAS